MYFLVLFSVASKAELAAPPIKMNAARKIATRQPLRRRSNWLRKNGLIDINYNEFNDSGRI